MALPSRSERRPVNDSSTPVRKRGSRSTCWTPRGSAPMTWLIEHSRVSASGSPRRHRSNRKRGLCGWNAVSVWNSSSTPDEVEVWRATSVRVGSRFWTMSPPCSGS